MERLRKTDRRYNLILFLREGGAKGCVCTSFIGFKRTVFKNSERTVLCLL